LNVQAGNAAPIPATLTLTGVAAGVVVNPQNPASALVCQLSSNQGNEASSFDLWASGYVTTTSTTNIVGKLASGTSTTDGTNTALGSSSASACNSASAPWRVHAELIYDSVSGKLNGTVEWLINNILTAKAVVATVVTGLKDNNSPVANFVLSFSSSAAAGGTPTTVVVKKFTVG
jgi:hypothetical protein